MIKKIFDLFNNLDIKIKKMIKKGFIFSLSFCIFAVIILFTYINFYSSPDLYYIGIKLLHTSFTFVVEFIICGFAVDKIAKQIN